MQLQELKSALRTTRVVRFENGQVHIGQDSLDRTYSPGFLFPFYGEAGIEIADAEHVKGNDRAVVIRGKTSFPVLERPAEGLANPLLKGPTEVLATFELVGDGMLGVTLCYELPQKWKFSNSFPDIDLIFENDSQQLALDSFKLRGCFFYLTTHDHKLDDDSDVSLEQGLNFVGRWTPDGMLGLFERLYKAEGGAEKLLYGPVITSSDDFLWPLTDDQLPWDDRQRIPGIHLRADLGFGVSLPPDNDKGMKLSQLGLRLYTPFSWMPISRNPSLEPTMAYVGELIVPSVDSKPLAIMKSTKRGDSDDMLVITGNFDSLTLDNISAALKDIAGGDDSIGILPEVARNETAGLGLRSASLTLLRSESGYEVGSTQFTIEMGESGGAEAWSPFPEPFSNLIRISLYSLKIAVVRPFNSEQRAVFATIMGTTEFLRSESSNGVELDVKVEYPGFYISAEQQGIAKIDLKCLKDQGMRLPDFLDFEFEIANIALVAEPGANYAFSMNLAPGKSWRISEKYTLPELALAVSCSTNEGVTYLGWQLVARTSEDEEAVPAVELIKHLCNEVVGFQLPIEELPPAIKRLAVKKVALSYSGKTERFGFECRGAFPLREVEGQPLAVDLTVEVNGKEGIFETKFHGTLSLKVRQTDVEFQVKICQAGSDTALSFTGEVTGGVRLSDVAADIAVKLGAIQSLPNVPDALNPTLTSVFGYLNTATKDLVLSAETESGSRLIVVAYANQGDKKYAILIDKYLHVGLSSLPLVGEEITQASSRAAGIEDVGIDSLQAIITYGVRTNEADYAKDIGLLNGIIDTAEATPGDLPRLPQTKPARIQPGDPQLRLRVSYFFADKPQPPLAFLDGPADQARFTPDSGDSIVARPPSEQSQATWLDVQRSFGPVSVRSLGIAFDKGDIRFLLDASIAVSGLTMDLQGLSLVFPIGAITKFDRARFLESLRQQADRMSTRLDGLSVNYKNATIAISGGLLRIDPPPPHTMYACNGQLLLKANTWALSVVGSFAQMDSGESSLFAYGALHATLGGPAFFFVTGLAAGFGYNRSLTLPTLNELPAFPLIAALNDDADRARLTEDIGKYAYPASGENWLAAGVRFTSFKVFDSFALVSVFIGDRLEVGLLGLSTLTVPARAKKRATPIAYAQLALEARYAPDDGVLKIAAQLTPNSYILSEKCHLTGGFALYTWSQDEFEKDSNGKFVYDDDGKDLKLANRGFRSGDFVLSIGGYHPDFKPPAHYPSVPRVGANWRVNDNLNIKGSLYFALTPLAIMAGGVLEANYQRGQLKAWFSSRVDFLLYWEPLYYHANMKVRMGASYTMGWGYTTKTITAQVGADVELYGPPFGGKAVFDLSVCSFTLDFGDASQLPQKLEWAEFEDRFLPDDSKVCLSRAAGGLIKELPAGDDSEDVSWVVNSEKLVIVTSSAIPCSELPCVNGVIVTDKKGRSDEDGKAIGKFGVKPCEILNGRLKSQQTIEWKDEHGVAVADVWEIELVTERLPRAAWHAPELSSLKDRSELSSRILDELREDQVSEELTTGFKLTPKRSTTDMAHRTEPVKFSALPMRSRDIPIADSAWENPAISRAGRYLADNRAADSRYTLLSEVENPVTLARRSAVADALKRQKIELTAKPDTRYLAAAAKKHELLAAPSIWELGEMLSS